MKTVLVLGDGQLGRSVENVLRGDGYDVYVLSKKQTGLNFLDFRKTLKQLQEAIDVHGEVFSIVNTIAYTNVDGAEKEQGVCNTINNITPSVIAEYLRDSGIKFVHFSTDFVYDDVYSKDLRFTEEDKLRPLNIYAESKAEADRCIMAVNPNSLILRVGGIYQSLTDGISGSCFVGKIASLKDKKTIEVVNDQFTSPTPVSFISESLSTILSSPEWKPGVYNLSCHGKISFFELAKQVLRNTQVEVLPVSSKDYEKKNFMQGKKTAKRPLNCNMDCEKIMNSYPIYPQHFSAYEKDYVL